MAKRLTLTKVREAARDCHACDLYKRGTQTVFGEGPSKAEVMLVGEKCRHGEMKRLVQDLARVAAEMREVR